MGMEFGFSSDQDMLRQSFAKFLEKETSLKQVNQWLQEEKGFPERLWKEMGNLGWLGLMYEEKYGGSQLSFMDLFILFEEMGAALLPSPFFTSAVLSGMLIREAGSEKLKEAYLPSLARGDKILTLAYLNERGKYGGDEPGVEALQRSDETFSLNGVALLVPYAHVADAIICCARVKKTGGGGPTLFLAARNRETIVLTPLHAVSNDKKFGVSFENTPVGRGDVIGGLGKGDKWLRQVLSKASVLKCGEMIGGLRRVLHMTVEYAKERRQFGRPLGSFQAVQHYCADMAAYLETSRLIAYQAASLLSHGKSCDKEVAMANAWCGQAYRKSTWMAHEIHGAIGFTEEYDLHLFYRHAKEAELLFGDARFHRSKVADEMGI